MKIKIILIILLFGVALFGEGVQINRPFTPQWQNFYTTQPYIGVSGDDTTRLFLVDEQGRLVIKQNNLNLAIGDCIILINQNDTDTMIVCNIANVLTVMP